MSSLLARLTTRSPLCFPFYSPLVVLTLNTGQFGKPIVTFFESIALRSHLEFPSSQPTSMASIHGLDFPVVQPRKVLIHTTPLQPDRLPISPFRTRYNSMQKMRRAAGGETAAVSKDLAARRGTIYTPGDYESRLTLDRFHHPRHLCARDDRDRVVLQPPATKHRGVLYGRQAHEPPPHWSVDVCDAL